MVADMCFTHTGHLKQKRHSAVRGSEGGVMSGWEKVKGEILTPDFYRYEPCPIKASELDGEFVQLTWPDGVSLRCYRLWLRENAMGLGGVDPATREGLLDPAMLDEHMYIEACRVDSDGHRVLAWQPEGRDVAYHSGWLKHVALGQNRPESWLPESVPWDAAGMHSPPQVDGRNILDDADALRALLNALIESGTCRIKAAPAETGFLVRLAERIGPIRDSNFGALWDVRADVRLAGSARTNTTANTGLRLGPHTDLPTRETPPGFQFLHCLVNDADGGASTLTDGAALTSALRDQDPRAFSLLSERNWIFFNRGPGIDHRWSAPVIDHSDAAGFTTLRAFYPVRAFPDMPEADIPAAYAALGLFHRMAADPKFELRFRLEPGDVLCFDNRRILHGRDAFTGSGLRHLQGIYIDRDEILSTARALNRAASRHS